MDPGARGELASAKNEQSIDHGMRRAVRLAIADWRSVRSGLTKTEGLQMKNAPLCTGFKCHLIQLFPEERTVLE